MTQKPTKRKNLEVTWGGNGRGHITHYVPVPVKKETQKKGLKLAK